MTNSAKIGLIGLGVMGQNLALNIERNHYPIAVFDRESQVVEKFSSRHRDQRIIPTKSPQEFVLALERPRKVILLVKAGDPVDWTIGLIKPFLQKGDIIVDGGNSYFKDTERRESSLRGEGLFLIGSGTSGGEKGALWGPSLMPGGDGGAYDEIKPIWEAIAAKVEDGPCVTYIGPGASGHFVKMVHNGIEYGDMQLIAAEVCHMQRPQMPSGVEQDASYDLAVIGAGPGGYVAAIRAGQLGIRTAIIEQEALGGVCLNWGCIPSKALLKNAEVLSYFHRAKEFGFSFENFHADYSVAIDRSRKAVERNTRGVAYLLRKNKVDHIQGSATLRGNGVVDIAPHGQRVSAKNIIIATGARPRSIPPLPVDGEKVITSRESIVLTELPSSIVIVGGGAIGVEFAYLYSAYGVAVTVVELLPRLVPNEDEEISRVLERSFSRQGIKMLTGASVTGFDTGPGGVAVKVNKDGVEQGITCEKVLVAIGVQPNSENLGLESLGIATDRGYIQIDETMSTNLPGVYAIGDVTGKLALAHVASAQGITAVEHLAGMETQPLDYVSMPRATYCQPQVASFGLTETQAREQGYEVKVGKFNVQASGKALAMGETEGLVKLVVDARYGELLGGHLIGPEVTELLGELSMTKMLEGTTLELGWVVHAHPTLSEMLKEAALDAEGRAVHM